MADTALYSTYNQIGQAEDVASWISMVSPEDTPMYTMFRKTKCTARNPEWQQDALAAAAQGGRAEGATWTATARVPTTLRTNYTQIIGDSFDVSETADAVKTHGRKKETNYQTLKLGKELRNNVEITFAGAAQTAALGADEQATRLMGNVLGVDPGANNIVATRDTGTANRTFDEAELLTGLQSNYTNGTTSTILMVNPTQAISVSNMAYASGHSRDNHGDSTKLVMVVDILVTPFNSVKGLKVVLNRYIPEGYPIAFDPEYWEIKVLRDWKRVPLAKTSDSEKFAIRWEGTLCHKNYSEAVIWEDVA